MGVHIDPEAVKAARATVAAIEKRQKELAEDGRALSDKYEALDEKVTAIQRAQRQMTEHKWVPETPTGGDKRLKRFIDDDTGAIRWRSKTVSVAIPGGPPVKSVQPGLLDVKVAANEWHQELLRLLTIRNLCRQMMGRNAHTPNLDADLYLHILDGPAFLQASFEKAFTGSTGEGAEWIDDQFLPELHQEFEIPRRLRALFPAMTVSTSTVTKPRLNRGLRPYVKGKISSDNPEHYTPSTPDTGKKTVNITGLAARILGDDIAMEDSAIMAATTFRALLRSALEDGWEDYAINGDDTAAHQDLIASWNTRMRWGAENLGGAADHRRKGKGLRRRAFDKSTALDLSGTMSAANFAALLGQLSEHAASSLLGVLSIEALVTDFMPLDEVLTLQNFGSQATVLSGQLASYMGVPLIPSRFMTSDLAATGLYTGTGATTGIAIADADAHVRLQRRGALVEVDKDIKSGAWEFVATLVEDLDSMDPDDAENVAYGYNL